MLFPQSDKSYVHTNLNIDNIEIDHNEENTEMKGFEQFLDKEIIMRGINISLSSLEKESFIRLNSSMSFTGPFFAFNVNDQILSPFTITGKLTGKRVGEGGNQLPIIGNRKIYGLQLVVKNLEVLPSYEQLCYITDVVNWIPVEKIKQRYQIIKNSLADDTKNLNRFQSLWLYAIRTVIELVRFKKHEGISNQSLRHAVIQMRMRKKYVSLYYKILKGKLANVEKSIINWVFDFNDAPLHLTDEEINEFDGIELNFTPEALALFRFIVIQKIMKEGVSEQAVRSALLESKQAWNLFNVSSSFVKTGTI